MPRVYQVGKKVERKENAKMGQSITFERNEVPQGHLKAVQSDPEIIWETLEKSAKIGHSLTIKADGYKNDGTFKATAFGQFADMKDGGYAVSIEGCSSYLDAQQCLVAMLIMCKHRLDNLDIAEVSLK